MAELLQDALSTVNGPNASAFIKAVIMQQIVSLSKTPEMDTEQIRNLERLTSMFCKLNSSDREETALMLNMQLTGTEANSKLLRSLEKALKDTK
jgi:hypothetical protein